MVKISSDVVDLFNNLLLTEGVVVKGSIKIFLYNDYSLGIYLNDSNADVNAVKSVFLKYFVQLFNEIGKNNNYIYRPTDLLFIQTRKPEQNNK